MRLVALGLAVAFLTAACGQTNVAPPTGTLVVQAMHTTWPDGSVVESGGWNYPFDLYALDPDGTHVRNLTHDAPTSYLFGRLADGRILYESEPNDRMKSGASHLYSVRADGTGLRELASGTGELLPQLSPDHRWIMFGHGGWLYVVRSDGSQLRRLARTNVGHYVPYVGPYDASWSPDGARIAFVRGFARLSAYGGPFHPRSALYVIDADGTNMRHVTMLRPQAVIEYPSWSPDGRRIAFVKHAYGGAHVNDYVYVMNADGSDKHRIRGVHGGGWFWLDDDRIAYYDESGGQTTDVGGSGKWRRISGRFRIGERLWITSGHAAGLWPVSPDGNWVAWVGQRQHVWVERLDGTRRRLVSSKVCCFYSNVNVEWAGR